MNTRRSRQIQLVTLGTVVLGACSDADLPKDRYAYKARTECVQDWGETNCERAPSSPGSSGYFYGPHFNSIVAMPDGHHIWSGNSSMPAINPRTGQQMHSAANVSAARGGFGHTGGAIASSGS
jgi:uncharacterized protein YgiB involved in biofilm formation